MKILIYKEIDGFQVVTSLSKQLMDRMESINNLNEQLKGTKEYVDVVKLKDDMSRVSKASAKEMMPAMVKLKDALKLKMKEMKPQCVKYFGLKKNEILISKEEFDSYEVLLKECHQEGKLLCVDKSKILNLVGSHYYIKTGEVVTKHIIEKVGEDYPAEAIVNPSEQEVVDAMDDTEKTSKYAVRKDALLDKISKDSIEFQLNGDSPSAARTKAVSGGQAEYDSLKALYKQS